MTYFVGLLLSILLLYPSSSWAVTGTLSPPANPQQTIYIISQSGIPFIKASSGSIGNNCAITAMTALPRTFNNGAYIWLPAGAVAAGVPAAATWYYFVASSTTAGTCYNNTYTSGTPTIPVSPTAFSTTGPGAFAGDTGTINGPAITIPGGMMGINGRVEARTSYEMNNTAGTKVASNTFGAATASSFSFSTHQSGNIVTVTANRSLAAIQNSTQNINAVTTANGSNQGDSAVDTTASVTYTLRLNAGTATDHLVLDSYSIIVYPQN